MKSVLCPAPWGGSQRSAAIQTAKMKRRGPYTGGVQVLGCSARREGQGQGGRKGIEKRGGVGGGTQRQLPFKAAVLWTAASPFGWVLWGWVLGLWGASKRACSWLCSGRGGEAGCADGLGYVGWGLERVGVVATGARHAPCTAARQRGEPGPLGEGMSAQRSSAGAQVCTGVRRGGRKAQLHLDWVCGWEVEQVSERGAAGARGVQCGRG